MKKIETYEFTDEDKDVLLKRLAKVTIIDNPCKIKCNGHDVATCCGCAEKHNYDAQFKSDDPQMDEILKEICDCRVTFEKIRDQMSLINDAIKTEIIPAAIKYCSIRGLPMSDVIDQSIVDDPINDLLDLMTDLESLNIEPGPSRRELNKITNKLL